MARVTYSPGNAGVLPPDQSFDITSIVAERFGAYVNYVSFCVDGTMFVIRATATSTPGGATQMTVVGWDHFSGADLLQSGVTNLPLQPLLDMMSSRNPSSTRAFAWLMGTDDTMTGSRTADIIKGLGGQDTLSGDRGNDSMVGGDGNDLISGGNGRDHLNGQAGDDTLAGGVGHDVLTGGTGADEFRFVSPTEGGDLIRDFAPGADHVALDGVGFGLLVPLVEGQSFVAGSAPTNSGPTVLYDAASGQLSYDADGTGAGVAILLATLSGAPALTLGDLWLI